MHNLTPAPAHDQPFGNQPCIKFVLQDAYSLTVSVMNFMIIINCTINNSSV